MATNCSTITWCPGPSQGGTSPTGVDSSIDSGPSRDYAIPTIPILEISLLELEHRAPTCAPTVRTHPRPLPLALHPHPLPRSMDDDAGMMMGRRSMDDDAGMMMGTDDGTALGAMAPLNTLAADDDYALFDACAAGDGRAATALLRSQSLSRDVIDAASEEDGTTALWHACFQIAAPGMTDVAFILIDVLSQDPGWRPSAASSEDGTGALHWACVHCEVDLALALIRCGADVNTVHTTDCSSPIWYASMQCAAVIALAILGSGTLDGGEMDCIELESNTNALFWAVRWSWVEPQMALVAQRLGGLQCRVDIVHSLASQANAATETDASFAYPNNPPLGDGDPCGYNPAGTSTLWWAAHTAIDGDARIAIQMLRAMEESGESCESLSSVATLASTTVLIEACFNAQDDFAAALAEAGADATAVCEADGTDALVWACRNALPLAAAAIIERGGVDPSVAEFETECTALYLAVVDPALRDVAFTVRCPALALTVLSLLSLSLSRSLFSLSLSLALPSLSLSLAISLFFFSLSLSLSLSSRSLSLSLFLFLSIHCDFRPTHPLPPPYPSLSLSLSSLSSARIVRVPPWSTVARRRCTRLVNSATPCSLRASSTAERS